MLVMFSSGVLLGILFDLFRELRDRLQLRREVQPFIDLFYWFLSAVLVFCLLWWSNWGEVRFYIFVAICFGFVVYFRYASEQISHMLRYIIRFLEAIITGLFSLLVVIFWNPLKKIVSILGALFWGLVHVPRSFVSKWFGWMFKKNREKK